MGIDNQTSVKTLNGGTVHGDVAAVRAAAIENVIRQRGQVQEQVHFAQSLKPETTITTVDNAAYKAQSGSVLSEGRIFFRRSVEILTRQRRAMAVYRVDHELIREANQPHAVMTILLLGIMIFIEAFINAAFLSNAHMVASSSAAMLTSVLISLTNVLSSCCAGFFVGRWLGYGRKGPAHAQFLSIRLWARMWQFLFIVLIGFFHVTVGLIRSMETLTKVEHSVATYLQLLHTPEAIFLVITGACLSLLAWHKGRTGITDPYADYGVFQKAIDATENEINAVQNDITERIEDVFEEPIAAETQAQAQHIKTITTFNAAVEDSNNAHQKLQQIIMQAESEVRVKTEHLRDLCSTAGGQLDEGFDMEAHCSFQSFLSIELPTPLAVPVAVAQPQHIQNTKADALAQLAALYAAPDTSQSEDQS